MKSAMRTNADFRLALLPLRLHCSLNYLKFSQGRFEIVASHLFCQHLKESGMRGFLKMREQLLEDIPGIEVVVLKQQLQLTKLREELGEVRNRLRAGARRFELAEVCDGGNNTAQRSLKGGKISLSVRWVRVPKSLFDGRGGSL